MTPIDPEPEHFDTMNHLDLQALTLLANRHTWGSERIPGDADLSHAIELTTRASYLEWVDQWKAAYRTLSAEIRTLKSQLRQAPALVPPGVYPAHLSQAKALARTLLALRSLAKRVSVELKQVSARAS